jgi:hypothetical protein
MTAKLPNYLPQFLRKLSSEQKKIIALAGLGLFFFFVFWGFIYTPQAKKLASLKKEISDNEAQIAAIMSLAQGKDLAQAALQLQASLSRLERQMQPADEAVIETLSQAAKALKIEIKYISPQEPKVLPDNAAGYAIREFPLNISLAADYRALGEYLRQLRDNFALLIRVRGLSLSGSEGKAFLDAELELSAYLASRK